MTIRTDRWIERWRVPKSSGDGDWIVAIDKDGNYGCSCPVWRFKRQECHHIKRVKNGDGDPQAPLAKPEYVLAKVQKPTLQNGKLLIPLVAIPDAMMMEVTICYYLLKNGYSVGEVRELRHIPSSWTVKAIMSHIELHGETVYPDGWYKH